MKLLIYSDLHLEFGYGWQIPPEADGDVLVLAGDICNLGNTTPLCTLLDRWTKPVVYVLGNHEFYTQKPMDQEIVKLQAWLAHHLPNVRLLIDEPCMIDGVNFFGGTMWTDFMGANTMAMSYARHNMNDYRLIVTPSGHRLRPEHTVAWHEEFKQKLEKWFEGYRPGPCIVVTHTAPIAARDTIYRTSPLSPAFVSGDMQGVIENNRFINLWIYGHTHECDDQRVGDTRVVSNQHGYIRRDGSLECRGFDPMGMEITI